MSDSTRYLPFVGRLLIGVVFLMSGLSKIHDYAGITTAISDAGLPFAALGFAVAVVVEVGLGLLLLVGYRARPVALAIWCVVTAIFFHRNFADQNMMIHFLKNIMIAGGLLQIVHFGAGSVSLDTLSRREMPDRSGGENFARQGGE
jgi:putative oxidoreductase